MDKTETVQQAVAAKTRRIHGAYLNFVARRLFSFAKTVHSLIAFLLITLGVTLTKYNTAKKVIRPQIMAQIYRAGVGLMPMVTFLAIALGLVVIGQTMFLLNQYGVQSYAGLIMVTVIVRELGPILAALLVLVRVGTATVIELGNARAFGQIEALEAVGIDPIHYLVMPRVIGLALSIFAITICLIILALSSGYLFAFLQGATLTPRSYIQELAHSLMWQDFILLTLKTFTFGALIAIVTCYEGLSRPLRLSEVAEATTRAVTKCVVITVLIDAIFIVVYLVI